MRITGRCVLLSRSWVLESITLQTRLIFEFQYAVDTGFLNEMHFECDNLEYAILVHFQVSPESIVYCYFSTPTSTSTTDIDKPGNLTQRLGEFSATLPNWRINFKFASQKLWLVGLLQRFDIMKIDPGKVIPFLVLALCIWDVTRWGSSFDYMSNNLDLCFASSSQANLLCEDGIWIAALNLGKEKGKN